MYKKNLLMKQLEEKEQKSDLQNIKRSINKVCGVKLLSYFFQTVSDLNMNFCSSDIIWSSSGKVATKLH